MPSISLSELFSDARISAYEKILGSDNKEQILSFYFQTMEASSKMLSLFNLIEIILRNNLNINIIDMIKQNKLNIPNSLSPEMWFFSVTDGFSKSHCKVINLKKHHNPPSTHNDYIARLDFGYYVYLLDDRHDVPKYPKYYIWQNGILEKVFPGVLKKHKTRKSLFGLLRQCDTMRNRLCHHEPMWKGVKKKPGKENAYINIRIKFNFLLDILFYLSPEMRELCTLTEFPCPAEINSLFKSVCKDEYSQKLSSINFI